MHKISVMSRGLYRGLLQLLYPQVCAACGVSLGVDQCFCDSCRFELVKDPYASCPRCASTVGPFVDVSDGCAHCRDVPFHFERAIRLGPYEGLLRELIIRMKACAGETVATMFAEVWAEEVASQAQAFEANAIVPIPLHWRRHWTRGYNQTEAFAKALGRRLRIPCQMRWLRRVRHSPPQTQQSPAGRRSQVQGAFNSRANTNLKGLTVLVVDDVLTTGSTCNDAARALRKAGADRVVVAVLAHSQP